MPGTGLDVKEDCPSQRPHQRILRSGNRLQRVWLSWGSPDSKGLILKYDQKHFNHAIQINEDTVLGEKAKY